MKMIKKLGFKKMTIFYDALAKGDIEMNHVLDLYSEIEHQDDVTDRELRTAENFVPIKAINEDNLPKEDVLVIAKNLKGIEYKLAKGCNPLYGDEVFGFVSIQGGIKIRRNACSKEAQIQDRDHEVSVKETC